MRPEERDAALLWDMLEAARKVMMFVRGLDARRFASDELHFSAVEHQLIVFGEAARRLSPSFKEAHSEIPWGRMVGLRNVVTHEYEKVDPDIIWQVATERVPELMRMLQLLIPPVDDAS